VIIVSGVVGPKSIAELLKSGASWFLAKPIKPPELCDYLRLALGDKGD